MRCLVDLLSPYAPLWPWLLERCHQNMRVVRNPDDPPSLQLQNEGQIEISTYDPDPEHASNILLHRRDGPTDERWCGWCRSVDYRADLTHFPTRGHVLEALAREGHRYPWALGSIWSVLTDEQAGRLTAEIVRRVGPDPKAAGGGYPVVPGVLSEWSEAVFHRVGFGPYNGYARSVIVGLSPGKNVCTVDQWGWRVGIHVNGRNGTMDYKSSEDVALLEEMASNAPPSDTDRKPKCNAFQGIGDETFTAGMALADKNVICTGAILIEQITP